MNTRKAINAVRKAIANFLNDPNFSNEQKSKLAIFLNDMQVNNHFCPKPSKVLWQACQLGLDHLGYGYYGTKCPK